MLFFILISILRPISNFLALFQLCDYMYNLILLANVKLFEKHFSAHKTLQTRCCWPDDRFWGLHDYITQRHTLTLLRHHSDSLLQRQRFVQKLLRETLWLDGGWDVFLVFSDCTHPDTFSSKCLLCRGSFQEKWHVLEMWKNTLKFSEPWLVKISLPDFLLTKFWTSGQPPFPHSGHCQKTLTRF